MLDTVNTIQYKGRAAMDKNVLIKNNYIVIPAGVRGSQMFKTVFENHSSHKVRVSLDSIQPPFSCSFKDFIIKP